MNTSVRSSNHHVVVQNCRGCIYCRHLSVASRQAVHPTVGTVQPLEKKIKTTPILTSQALYSRSRLSVSVKKCVCVRVDYVWTKILVFVLLVFCLDITINRHNNTKARSSLERSCDIVHVANTSVCRSGLGSSTLYFTTTYSRPYTLHLNFLCVISSTSVLRWNADEMQ